MSSGVLTVDVHENESNSLREINTICYESSKISKKSKYSAQVNDTAIAE